MKLFHFILTMVLMAAMAVAVGCGNEEDDDPPVSRSTDDPDAGPEGDGGDSDIPPPLRTECEDSKLCINLEHPEDCVANFSLGTTQAGSDELGYETHVGVYGYTDKTEGSWMVPQPNNYDSEPTVFVNSCEKEDDSVLRINGTGFNEWGFGVGVDWGGPENPACETEEALECLEVFYDDSNFKLVDAEADPRCQDEDGNPDPEKLRCCIHTKKFKITRDLSEYKGIGFWVANLSEDGMNRFQINFGVPESTRFFLDPNLPEEYRRDDVTYEGGCSDDDGEDATKCYNDFAYIFTLPKPGKWEYIEITFDQLAFSEHWGLQMSYKSFPKNKSVGIKFQTPSDGSRVPSDYYDFLIDDIHFVR